MKNLFILLASIFLISCGGNDKHSGQSDQVIELSPEIRLSYVDSVYYVNSNDYPKGESYSRNPVEDSLVLNRLKEHTLFLKDIFKVEGEVTKDLLEGWLPYIQIREFSDYLGDPFYRFETYNNKRYSMNPRVVSEIPLKKVEDLKAFAIELVKYELINSLKCKVTRNTDYRPDWYYYTIKMEVEAFYLRNFGSNWIRLEPCECGDTFYVGYHGYRSGLEGAKIKEAIQNYYDEQEDPNRPVLSGLSEE